MYLRICDVEHGACALITPTANPAAGPLAMIDVGDASDFQPSHHIRNVMGRSVVDYLFITNADQDHISDLDGLAQSGISVATFYRNASINPQQLQLIKQQGGPLTADMQRYLALHSSHIHPVTRPFDGVMGGITARTYCNSYPTFEDTNNLSLVAVFDYYGFRVMFPGDLEKDGWLALLARPDFRAELEGVNVFVASHHGRENGYCEKVFDFCRPKTVIMSDKAIIHDTQYMAGVYGRHVGSRYPNGVRVATTGKQRLVLSTRRDGHIEFTVNERGDFWIHTEYMG